MNKKSLIRYAIFSLFLISYNTILFAKDYNVSGTVVDADNKKVGGVTVLLLTADGIEYQRTNTSKPRMGMGGGSFKFKDVLPGDYALDVDGGAKGKVNTPITITDDDVKNIELVLLLNNTEVKKEKAPEGGRGEITIPDEATESGSSQEYVATELSFELKKLGAEIKNLNSEMEDLKALSKMWINPLAIYSKEIILQNGSTVFGKIVYQDEETLKIETLVGYLIIERKNVVRVIDNVVTEETQEYVPEQIRDSYSPPPMPKLAEPKYTSADPLSREASKRYSANCVLVGNVSERKDNQGAIIFTGEVKNIGGRRADFVKVDFVFRKNWSGETKTLTTFIRGTYHTFDSGITTDATLLPGSVGAFELFIPNDFGSFIGYSYVIDWEEYE
ncbi:MAG TPA: carboxypeptidase regulatory-like domain-containing protein [Candidatus Marinimicrobia bacterium]|nr:carboxypeptidase regulatory-like domain-containing protein [Candidatus Neomarinimicrobiota bacterium]